RGSSWQARGAILSTPLPRAAAARTPVAPQAAARPLPRHPHPAEPERGVLADADELGEAQERQERPGVAPVYHLTDPAFEQHVLAAAGGVAPPAGPVGRALVDLDGVGERLELRLLLPRQGRAFVVRLRQEREPHEEPVDQYAERQVAPRVALAHQVGGRLEPDPEDAAHGGDLRLSEIVREPPGQLLRAQHVVLGRIYARHPTAGPEGGDGGDPEPAGRAARRTVADPSLAELAQRHEEPGDGMACPAGQHEDELERRAGGVVPRTEPGTEDEGAGQVAEAPVPLAPRLEDPPVRAALGELAAADRAWPRRGAGHVEEHLAETTPQRDPRERREVDRARGPEQETINGESHGLPLLRSAVVRGRRRLLPRRARGRVPADGEHEGSRKTPRRP